MLISMKEVAVKSQNSSCVSTCKPSYSGDRLWLPGTRHPRRAQVRWLSQELCGSCPAGSTLLCGAQAHPKPMLMGPS